MANFGLGIANSHFSRYWVFNYRAYVIQWYWTLGTNQILLVNILISNEPINLRICPYLGIRTCNCILYAIVKTLIVSYDCYDTTVVWKFTNDLLVIPGWPLADPWWSLADPWLTLGWPLVIPGWPSAYAWLTFGWPLVIPGWPSADPWWSLAYPWWPLADLWVIPGWPSADI